MLIDKRLRASCQPTTTHSTTTSYRNSNNTADADAAAAGGNNGAAAAAAEASGERAPADASGGSGGGSGDGSGEGGGRDVEDGVDPVFRCGAGVPWAAVLLRRSQIMLLSGGREVDVVEGEEEEEEGAEEGAGRGMPGHVGEVGAGFGRDKGWLREEGCVGGEGGRWTDGGAKG